MTLAAAAIPSATSAAVTSSQTVMLSGSTPHIEVLYFDGCPSYGILLPRLRKLVAQAGGDPELIRTRRVQTMAEAVAERFLGSPTVRVNGRDVDPGAAGREDCALGCRIYRDATGASPLPPDAWIQAALTDPRR